MAPENLRDYLEGARQRRVREQDVRQQEMAARHEARRLEFEARSEPLNLHVVKVLEEARTALAEGGAKLEYKFHSYNAGKQLENPRVEFQISSIASSGAASSVYVVEIVRSGEVVVRTKQSFWRSRFDSHAARIEAANSCFFAGCRSHRCNQSLD